MGHYAFLDENNIVTEIITGRNEDEVVDGISDWETHYGEFRGQVCKRTSYNTFGNVHRTGGIPFRKNFAGIGFTWDGVGFSAPQPYSSWSLNSETYLWEAPITMPTDEKIYAWNESTLSWDEVN